MCGPFVIPVASRIGLQPPRSTPMDQTLMVILLLVAIGALCLLTDPN